MANPRLGYYCSLVLTCTEDGYWGGQCPTLIENRWDGQDAHPTREINLFIVGWADGQDAYPTREINLFIVGWADGQDAYPTREINLFIVGWASRPPSLLLQEKKIIT